MPEHFQNQGHPALVVIAEDEGLIRACALEALREAGFAVVEAAHSDDALAVLRAEGESVHALFTDVQMPGGSMDGLALAHHARDNWPWVAIVIASGDAAPDEDCLPSGSRFVRKPYCLREVVVHMRELISAARH